MLFLSRGAFIQVSARGALKYPSEPGEERLLQAVESPRLERPERHGGDGGLIGTREVSMRDVPLLTVTVNN